ncbi:hypothetical protein HMPREF9323_1217 [Veillonella parvula ACS-068-V-Sch12]|nr:hypothetical protein HMPREF9323_1217 [Veillonella parvula ACS-068-V-Sch12]
MYGFGFYKWNNILKAKDNKCLISSRAAIIWWNPKEIVIA